MTPGTAFTPHVLHATDRLWPETNCYSDLWIELLAVLDEVPEAAFGFGITQGYDGDQFTFAKPPVEDLRRLFGLGLQELSIYRSLEDHARRHIGRGAIVLLEVDAFYLPDTAATAYRQRHVKTTIAVDRIEAADRRARYFHNAMRGVLLDEDYLGAFRLKAEFRDQADLLPPYVEVVQRLQPRLAAGEVRRVARAVLRENYARRPKANPFSAWHAAFAADTEALLSAPEEFHDYAFHFPRSAGSNFELLGSHLLWLDGDALAAAAAACFEIARATKVLQFRLARAVARRRPDPCEESFSDLTGAYARLLAVLASYCA